MTEFILVLLAVSNLTLWLWFNAEIKDLKRALLEAYEARMIRQICEKVEKQARELFPCDCDLCKEEENDCNN